MKKFGEFYIFRIGRDWAQIQMKKGKFFSSKRKCVIYAESLLICDYIRTLQLLNFLIFLTMPTEDGRNSLAKINKPVAIKLNGVFNWFMANKIISIILNPAIVRFKMASPYREGGDVVYKNAAFSNTTKSVSVEGLLFTKYCLLFRDNLLSNYLFFFS